MQVRRENELLLLPREQRRTAEQTEESLLGACLLDGSAAVEVAVQYGLAERMFATPSHRALWSALEALYDRGAEIDTAAALAELALAGKAAAGLRLETLVEAGVGGAAMVPTYVDLVRESAALREVIAFADDLGARARGRRGKVDEIVAAAREGVAGLGLGLHAGLDVGDRNADLDRILSRLDRPATEGRIPTGFVELDALLRGGLRPGALAILAARPAMGKTALAHQIACHVADRGLHVLMVSLEMTREELVERELVGAAKLTPEQWRTRDGASRAVRASDLVRHRPLAICDSGVLDLSAMVTGIERAIADGVSLVVIDYLQLARSSERYAGQRTQEVGEVSRALKATAKNGRVPIIALSQLNRALELRADKRPGLSDLRESGDLEQDADVVAFLHRPEYFLRDKTPDNLVGVAEVLVAKHRGGPTGVVQLYFDARLTRFGALARGDA